MRDWYLFLGDETTISTFVALRGMVSAATQVFGAVEVAADEQSCVAELLPDLTVVPRTSIVYGLALANWLREVKQLSGQGVAYLAGHAQSIQQLRAMLIERHGVKRQQVKTKPYWADGKRGL